MKVSYPVVFCRLAVEYAGLVIKASPRDEQPPTDPTVEVTSRQALGELRCDIAFFDPVIAGWRIAYNVRYIALDEIVPDGLDGDVYYETGAPDPAERKEHHAMLQAKLERVRSGNAGGMAGSSIGARARELEDDETRQPRQGDQNSDGTPVNPDDFAPQTGAELSVEEDVSEALLGGDGEDRARTATEIEMDREGGPASAELKERQGGVVREQHADPELAGLKDA